MKAILTQRTEATRYYFLKPQSCFANSKDEGIKLTKTVLLYPIVNSKEVFINTLFKNIKILFRLKIL